MSDSATPRTAAHQASLSITNSQSLLKLMSIKSVIPSNHLILCRSLLLPSIFPSIRVFSNESLLCIRCWSIGVSASASVLPMNTQDWSPLGWIAWNSLQSKRLSRIFSSTTIVKHQFFGTQHSLWPNFHHLYMTIVKIIALTIQTFISKVVSLLFHSWVWNLNKSLST